MYSNMVGRSILVVGLGSMGRRRIRLIKQMKIDIKIYGVDSNIDRANKVKAEYIIDVFSSIEEAFKSVNVDCVFVCTSPLVHSTIVREALMNSCDVFSEIDLIIDGIEDNIRLAAEKGKIYFVSSTPLYNEQMQQIIDMIVNDGNRMMYNYHVGQYLPDWHPWENYKDFFVGEKNTNGCREILAIELPWLIAAFGDVEEVSVKRNKFTKLNIGYDDGYSVQLVHKNGTIGHLMVDVVCRRAIRHLEIFNEDTYIMWNGDSSGLTVYDNFNKQITKVTSTDFIREKGYNETINEYDYYIEIAEFFNALDGKRIGYTAEDEIHMLKIIDCIEKE